MRLKRRPRRFRRGKEVVLILARIRSVRRRWIYGLRANFQDTRFAAMQRQGERRPFADGGKENEQSQAGVGKKYRGLIYLDPP
jgi:hypothetical protein